MLGKYLRLKNIWIYTNDKLGCASRYDERLLRQFITKSWVHMNADCLPKVKVGKVSAPAFSSHCISCIA